VHARAEKLEWRLSRSTCRASSGAEVDQEEAQARHREDAEVRRREEAGARVREDAEATSWVSSQLPHWRVSRMGGRVADDSSGQ
jgi:hypothetical protein